MRPDRNRRVGHGEVDVVGGRFEELPADRLGHQQEHHDGEDDGDPQAPEHGVEDAPVILGPTHFAVQGRAPVGPEQVEHQEGDQGQGGAEGEGVERGGAEACLGSHLDGVGVGVALVAEEARGLAVDRVVHAALPVDEQDEGHDRQPGKTDPEAELLNPRVALHAQRHHDRDEGQQDEAGDEEPGSGRVRSAQERGPVLAADGGADRGQHHLVQSSGVDRGPVPEDEPPAGHREYEGGAAAQDAALPGVIAARPGHGGDQERVGDHQKRDRDAGDDDGAHHVAAGNGGDETEGAETECDQIDRHERVDERIEARPRLDEPGGIPQEEALPGRR